MSARPGVRGGLPTRDDHTSSAEPEFSTVDVAALADAVAARLAAAPPPDALLDAEGAAALLTVPASWVLAEARADRIPHVRLGRYVRFDRAELQAWAAERGRGPRRRTGARPVPQDGDRR